MRKYEEANDTEIQELEYSLEKMMQELSAMEKSHGAVKSEHEALQKAIEDGRA